MGAPLAPRRFRFWRAVWACLLGPGLGCAQPFLAGLSGCVFCAFVFVVPVPPSPFFRAGLLALFVFLFFFMCYSPPLLAWFRCRWWWAVPATPGWGPLAAVVRGVWCVVCGGGVLVGLWLVCGVVGPSPLLVEVPVCYSPPLPAGFRCRWWWAVPAIPGWGPLAAVVCGVWCVVSGEWW